MKKFHSPVQLETPRLIIRPWKASDLEPFSELNADPEVMCYFPTPLSKDESNSLADRIQLIISENGWGFWAVELKQNQQFIGFTGLHHQPEQFDFSPCTEIGWRYAKQFWHQGYATEAAQACLDFAFQQLDLNEVVAFTATQNTASEKVMQRLGMCYVKNFIHPKLNPQHPLATHLLYQIQASEFRVKSFSSL